MVQFTNSNLFLLLYIITMSWGELPQMAYNEGLCPREVPFEALGVSYGGDS